MKSKETDHNFKRGITLIAEVTCACTRKKMTKLTSPQIVEYQDSQDHSVKAKKVRNETDCCNPNEC